MTAPLAPPRGSSGPTTSPKRWTEATLDTPATSTVWGFGQHASDPDLIFAGTKYGNLFRSTDGGRSFTKEWRDFPEITDVAWTPAVAAEPPAVHH